MPDLDSDVGGAVVRADDAFAETMERSRSRIDHRCCRCRPKRHRHLLAGRRAITTISPYLFFWQASQEAEEAALSNTRKGGKKAEAKGHQVRQISLDTWIGMAVSNTIGFFIIVTTAATLHVHGVMHIETAAQAAEALGPIAGDLTFVLFALGIVGTGLLAVPVLAGSAAYAVAKRSGSAAASNFQPIARSAWRRSAAERSPRPASTPSPCCSGRR